jgi:acyl dehydratase
MQARKLYWTEVQVGETLPPLVKEPVTRVQLVKYAGASGDFNPMHVDEVYAKEAGMPGVFGHGMLLMGFLGQLVTGWAGVNGKLGKLGARFVKIVWPGDVITCCGRVLRLDHHAGTYTVSLDLWAENQKGELVVKGSAEVQLFHSPDDEARQVRGEGPLVISNKPPPALEERIGAPMEPVRKVSRRPSRRKSASASGRSRPAAKTAAPRARPATTRPATTRPSTTRKKATKRATPAKAAKGKAAKGKATKKPATRGQRTTTSRAPAARRATSSAPPAAAKRAGSASKRSKTAKKAPKRASTAKRAKTASRAAPKKRTAKPAKATARKVARKAPAAKKKPATKKAAKKTASRSSKRPSRRK